MSQRVRDWSHSGQLPGRQAVRKLLPPERLGDVYKCRNYCSQVKSPATLAIRKILGGSSLVQIVESYQTFLVGGSDVGFCPHFMTR